MVFHSAIVTIIDVSLDEKVPDCVIYTYSCGHQHRVGCRGIADRFDDLKIKRIGEPEICLPCAYPTLPREANTTIASIGPYPENAIDILEVYACGHRICTGPYTPENRAGIIASMQGDVGSPVLCKVCKKASTRR